MTVITVQMFQGPILNRPQSKQFWFTPATSQVLLVLAGSASCVAPPDYLGIKPMIDGETIPDPYAPGQFASARIFDDGSPNRQTFVRMAVLAKVNKGARHLLTLEPLSQSTVTDEKDVFALEIYDVGE
jgi:hypothetical protein